MPISKELTNKLNELINYCGDVSNFHDMTKPQAQVMSNGFVKLMSDLKTQIELDQAVNPKLVKLQYFKPSGKFYAEATYETDQTMMDKVFDEIEGFQLNGTLPGLVPNGGKDLTIHVDGSNLPFGYPIILKAIR